MTDGELKYLDEVVARSKERKRGFFGEFKTTRAEVAEIVMIAFVPSLLAEIKALKARIEPGTAEESGAEE